MSTDSICVYAICKNEAENVEGWLKPILAEAMPQDTICVLDTGSTDDTLKKLLDCRGSFVDMASLQINHAVFSPFRFDHARNTALSLVPVNSAFCVRLDLDERLPSGWRKTIASFIGKADRLRYDYVWDHMPNGDPGCVYKMDLIHGRFNYSYSGATHESLNFTPEQNVKERIEDCGLTIHQYANPNKAAHKDLFLTKLSVEENRAPRNLFYYGRELYYKGFKDRAIEILTEYLTVSTWYSEKSEAQRIIGQCLFDINDKGRNSARNSGDARAMLMASCMTDPQLRDNWLALAEYATSVKDWNLVHFAAISGLQIAKRTNHYMTRAAAWSYQLTHHAALSAYHTGNIALAKHYGAAAYSIAQAHREPQWVLESMARNCEFYNGKVAGV